QRAVPRGTVPRVGRTRRALDGSRRWLVPAHVRGSAYAASRPRPQGAGDTRAVGRGRAHRRASGSRSAAAPNAGVAVSGYPKVPATETWGRSGVPGGTRNRDLGSVRGTRGYRQPRPGVGPGYPGVPAAETCSRSGVPGGTGSRDLLSVRGTRGYRQPRPGSVRGTRG